jgi:hypothetical protein
MPIGSDAKRESIHHPTAAPPNTVPASWLPRTKYGASCCIGDFDDDMLITSVKNAAQK